MYGEKIDQIKINNQENVSELGLAEVLFSRYTFDVPISLDNAEARGLELISIPLAIRNLIDTDAIRTQSPLFPDTQIPTKLLDNNEFARTVLRKKLDMFLSEIAQTGINRDQLQSFMIANHEWIKWGLNTWFIVNSSTMAEIVVMDESVEKITMDWMLTEFGIDLGQPITHPHLVSENGKRRLYEAGFPNVSKHLTRDDYAEMLVACYELSIATEGSRGFFGRSWIYNPAIHLPLSDGKPFVAFNFLQHDYLAGMRKHLVTASPHGMFPDQYMFATRNPRRKAFVESGEFIPEVYGVVHTNEFFKQNIDAGLLSPGEL